MNEKCNQQIKCSVDTCAYHCTSNCCSLNEIKVGCCASDVSNCAGTECASFSLGDSAVKNITC